jgi:transcriptional regulator with XRE-family HTH domain
VGHARSFLEGLFNVGAEQERTEEMKSSRMSFGQYLAMKRRQRGLTLKEMAALVKKENGKPISFQYLSEIENDRRNPPSDHLIEELASVLNMKSPYMLYIKARRLPPVFQADDERQAVRATKALLRQLESIAA